jgi:hypothetical protein
LLEPCAAKVARTVLRGAGRSNASGLPGGESQEVLLVDAVEHLDDGALKDLVLHGGNP